MFSTCTQLHGGMHNHNVHIHAYMHIRISAISIIGPETFCLVITHEMYKFVHEVGQSDHVRTYAYIHL